MGRAPKVIGVDMGHVAKLREDMQGSAPDYGAPVALPELTKLALKMASSLDKYYSDNGVSEIFGTTSGVQLGVSVAGLEQSLIAALRGLEPPAEDAGVLSDMAEQGDYVAFGYRRMIHGKTVDGRQKYRYVWIFKVMFSPADEDGETLKEKPAVQEPALVAEGLSLDAFQPEHRYWRYTMDNWMTWVTPEHEADFFRTVRGYPGSELLPPEPEPGGG